jgi:hypothetical protein
MVKGFKLVITVICKCSTLNIKENFGREPSNDYFIKVWFQLSNWFQTRRCLCEFSIGSYVKLSSTVGAILEKGEMKLIKKNLL